MAARGDDEPQVIRIGGTLYRLEPVDRPGLAHCTPIATFARLVDQYLTASAVRTKPSTAAKKREALTLHVLPVLGSLLITEVTRVRLVELQTALAAKMSARSVNNVMAHAQAALAWAVDMGMLEGFRPVRGLRAGDTARAYRRDHYEALLRATEGWPHVLLLLLGDAGLRIGEAAALRWECVGTRLCICATRYGSQRLTPKGGRRRMVPVTKRLAQALRELAPEGALVVPRKLDSAAFMRRFEVTCARLDIPRVNAHALRHSYASELQRRGVGTATIRDLLGHRSVAVTDRYLHSEAAGLAEAVALLDKP